MKHDVVRFSGQVEPAGSDIPEKPLMDPIEGLLFQNRHDHKIVCTDPTKDPGQNTTRLRIYSPKYFQIELYDHIVRRKN
ncbi:Uncharacterized protein C4orf22 homolog [Eumeta japonica]|uniref:Cilia- and flagella-associated protein 299 n=1 Tax=Eumeta variegata TaxID=151549 RepID=A0A4C1UZ58_EUMVA|nr:Uncharacterized protein C4orf22 homolog [Eumeta japonica]